MNYDPQELLRELERRDAAQSQLAPYAQYTLQVTPALHHRVICQAIDELLNDDYDELIINSPPGSAKSTYTSHALAAYYLGRYPTNNIICATHTADLSERWSAKVQASISTPEHQRLFPSSTLSRTQTAKSRWATSEGGEFLAAGVGGSILGFRADLGIIDDPISGFEQAQSQTQLAKVHGWYETDFVTRLKPQAKVVLICQRLSPNDLAGYLIARNIEQPTRRQRVLIIQMEATEDFPDPMGRQPGERLWPEWFTPQMVTDAKRDEFKWKTLYQQHPPSETGSWVAPDEIQFRPRPSQSAIPEVIYGCSDLALSVNSGDYTVHFVVAVDHNQDWDIIDAVRERVDPNQSATRLVTLCETYAPREWLIDDDNASKVFMPLVATRARQTSTPIPWRPLPLRGQDKETRAAPLRGQFKRRKVYMPADAPFKGWLVREILSFPNAMGDGVDDGIDALSLLGRRLIAITSGAPHLRVVPPAKVGYSLEDLYDERKMNTAKRRV